ncbi:uncharacterized protein H6S33_001891 [Morchella sextelata]|uniref:uncharacterized protein n=1 Tax=Morchella sextelata TaxID=1174677 RepID=UPI001D049FB1|nr:uncharacterized protein H6S33_001891 [Morchella sextelata]KAH0608757.1 hypothetical protein H6S33_001891 [Morchella sextelata]
MCFSKTKKSSHAKDQSSSQKKNPIPPARPVSRPAIATTGSVRSTGKTRKVPAAPTAPTAPTAQPAVKVASPTISLKSLAAAIVPVTGGPTETGATSINPSLSSVTTPAPCPAVPGSVLPSQPPEPSRAVQSTYRSLWEEARKSKKLTREELDSINTDQDIRQVLEELVKEIERKKNECEDKQWTYTTRGGDKRLVRDSVSACLTNLTKLVPVGDATVAALPSIASAPWGVLKFLLKAVTAGVDNTRIIHESIENLSRILSNCNIYESLYIEGSSLKGQYAQGIGEAVWKELDKLLKDVSDGEKEVRDAADLAAKEGQSRVLEGLAKTLESVVYPISRIESKLDKLFIMMQDDERSKVLGWISNMSFKEHHILVNSLRHPDTGKWLLEKESFLQWKKPDSKSLFWLHGPPGSGKTLLSSNVIDLVRPKYNEHCIAYFYCNYKESGRREPESILRSIVKQICLQSPTASLPEPLLSIYRQRVTDDDLGRNLDIVEIKDLLVKLCGGFLQTAIVIDALDECYEETRWKILDILKHVLDSTLNIKIFVTSRNDADLRRALEGSPDVFIQERDNTEDINLYIDSEIEVYMTKRRFLCGHISDELKKRITEKLREKAHGMFLWVKYQLDRICLEATFGGILTVLDELPETLNETYSEIMKRINNKKGSKRTRDMANKVLAWMLYALRPLSTAELIEAISEPYSLSKNDLTESTILDICCNLVVFDEGFEVLRFAHFSVQEFLLSEIGSKKSHTMMADVCLTSLMHETEPGTPGPALQGYSTSNWAAHVRSSDSERDVLKDFWTKFLQPCRAYNEWVGRISKEERRLAPVEGKQLTPLMVACYYQLSGIVESLLDEGVNFEGTSFNWFGDTILHLCVINDNLSCLQLLLERGADINVPDLGGSTPLAVAARNGHEKAVRALLEKGAAVDCLDGNGLTPLSYAANWGHEKVVRALLEKGAAVDFLDGAGRTPLSYAAERGHEKVVRALLEKGAAVDCLDGNGLTPLSYAAVWGNEKVVRALLEKGAAVDCLDGAGRTPLSYAAERGHENMVRTLLEKGAAVDCLDGAGRTPLSYAAARREEKIVRALLEKGAAVDCLDGDGRTPLSYAAQRGHEKVVQALLEKGAAVDCLDGDSLTPLSYAAVWGNEKVVRALLEKGAAVDCLDGDGRTPLSYAVQWGHEKVVQALLEKGAAVDFLDGDGRTPLSYAAARGEEKIVRALLEKGAAVDCLDGDGRTPLSCAAETGHEKVVRALLEKGAAVDCLDGNGRTPLSYAAQRGNEKVVQALLEKGAAVDCLDGNGLTPLSYTAVWGNEKVVRALLEKGAAVDCLDGDGGTPLSYAVQWGHEKVVKALLEKGAAVDCLDGNGLTPLSYAAVWGNEKVVRALLEKGAAVHCLDGNGLTPLSYAANWGHEKVVRALLEKGAAVDCLDGDGRTPLSYAAETGHEKVVRALLEKGAAVDCLDGDGRTPLSYAAQRDHEKVVQALLEKGADMHIPDGIYGRTPLSSAAAHGFGELVRVLLQKGAHVESRDKNGHTPLARAAGEGHETVVKVLLEHGADVDSRDEEGRTPLSLAAAEGHEEVVRVLLKKGAHVESRDKDGRTPLSRAADAGHVAVVRVLLENGADVDSRDEEGRTSLSWAAAAGHEKVVQMLKERGAM